MREAAIKFRLWGREYCPARVKTKMGAIGSDGQDCGMRRKRQIPSSKPLITNQPPSVGWNLELGISLAAWSFSRKQIDHQFESHPTKTYALVFLERLWYETISAVVASIVDLSGSAEVVK